MEYVIARDLGRTRAELLSTTSALELTWWKGLYMVEAEERAAAADQAARERAREAQAMRAARRRRGR